MSKKSRKRPNGPVASRGRSSSAARLRSMMMAPVVPVDDVVEYTTFMLNGKHMPLYWCDPEKCKRDFDNYFTLLQEANGEADLRAACDAFPEVVASMKTIMPSADAGDNDDAETVRVCWEKSRATMLYVTREYYMHMCKQLCV